jgi:sugar O-acyltransferase (sialic acid O-acetyltransferase NeuD family)
MSNLYPSKLLIVGSSGHASVIIDALQRSANVEIVGYLDDAAPTGAVRHNYPVLGLTREAADIGAKLKISHFALAIGDNWLRHKMFVTVSHQCPAANFIPIVHPSAIVARSALLGKGAVVLAQSHIGPGSRVGEFCIVNTGASLDHDCVMHDFSSIAPGVFTGGQVEIGEFSAVGVGASVSNKITIGRHCVVGTGSVVVRDIPEFVTAYGNPAKVIRAREAGDHYLG